MTSAEPLYLLWILYATHVYYVCPSTAVSFYLAASIGLQATNSWKFWQDDHFNFSFHDTGYIWIYLALLVLHETPKWHMIPNEVRNKAGRQSAYGVFGRILALWVLPTIICGYQAALKTSEFDGLPPELLTNHIMPRFEQIWSRCKLNQDAALIPAPLANRFRPSIAKRPSKDTSASQLAFDTDASDIACLTYLSKTKCAVLDRPDCQLSASASHQL